MLLYMSDPFDFQGIQKPLELFEHRVEGTLVQVSISGNSLGRVERILSTNPQDYLKQALQPGVTIPLYR